MSLVEKVLGVSMINGQRCYLLKWKNYSSSMNSWEPEDNLNCDVLIKEFHKAEELKALSKKFQLPTTVAMPVDSLTPYGFDRGLKPEAICGVTRKNGALFFLIKWCGCTEADVVPAVQANVKCPQLVIKFYENSLFLED